jgi:kynureninase
MYNIPMEPKFRPERDFAAELDRADALVSFRSRFVIADPDLIYLDGNSLGRLPVLAAGRVRHAVEQEWGQDLVRGWSHGWWEAPERAGEKIAHLVGAAPGEVTVCDSTSVNLFKVTLAALALRHGRTRIVTDTLNFPSDLYVLQGCARVLGDRHNIVRVGSRDGEITPDLEALDAAIDTNTALVSLSHVTFKSGYLYNLAAVTGLAHARGALVLWDLCHSVGAVPVELDAWGADFAIGCTYKYLNGGPGSPAFLYVRHELQDQVLSPIWGWWGQQAPFAFGQDYTPAPGVARFLAGTQPMLSLLAMEAGLDDLLAAGMPAIRRKSLQLTEYLISLAEARLVPLGFHIGTPRDPERRGSHVSLRHPEGYRINRALIEEMNVLPDFREPDNIRLGLAPLYNSFEEVWEGVERIRRTVEEQRYLKYPPARLNVT